ncbi:MAG: phosphoglycerate kinase [Candidatus Neomarinimicrobiota bacterium]|nr:phosphoglycerate kinase [Candidatus Neomarinimicrobiota bacterium]MED5451477.1 phosphoglycerate kinase [Candidatus Neomarinimicrobiota bacterium]
MLRKLKSFDIQSRRVLIRVDFNVPIGNDIVTDDYRIQRTIPTIKHCLDQGAKVVLMSHLGRPKGKINPKFSLMPAGERLAELLEIPIKFSHDCVSDDAIDVSHNLQSGEVHLLENLRFHDEEIENNNEFATKLSKHGEIYLNDAFGTAHREHASNVGIVHNFMHKGIGLLIEKELEFLSDALKDPLAPVLLIIGGAKIDTKIDVIHNFLGLADNIVIGGAMANTFLTANGYNMGKSLVEMDKLEIAKRILLDASKTKTKIILPIDFNGELDEFGSGNLEYANYDDIKKNMICEDIGELSVNLFADIISRSKTIFWNGTVGVAENKDFAFGTERIIDKIIENECIAIAGGGDTITAIRNYDSELIDKLSHASTGGGACLELLSGRKLPAIEILDK